MKTIFFCATALTMTGATMAAGSDWTALDREVEALSSSLAPQGGGVAIGGFIDMQLNEDSDNDASFFHGRNLRLGFSAENSGYGVTVGTQWASGDGEITDAYVTTGVGSLTVTAGQFKAPMGTSGGRADRDGFFQDRSNIGANFAGRDQGIMLGGAAGAFNWGVAIQNGTDVDGDPTTINDNNGNDEYATTVHLGFNIMGGMSSDTEGCYGAGDGMGMTIGLSSHDDGDDATDESVVLDFALSNSTFSFSAEFADNGGATTGAGAEMTADPENVTTGIGESPSAFAATMAVGANWEIGVRFQDGDASDDDEDLDIAANYYVSGHDVKYTIGYSDDDDSDVITIGLQVGF